jgi:hypothetical protein
MALDEKVLLEVRTELERFDKKLSDTIKKFRSDKHAKYGCKETGAVRRAALDLKNELTKITQHYGK